MGEFVDELHKMRTMEIRTLVYLTRQHVLEMKESLKELAAQLEMREPLPENYSIIAPYDDMHLTRQHVLEMKESLKELSAQVHRTATAVTFGCVPTERADGSPL